MAAVFLGTPTAAIPSLTALAQVAEVSLVVTQPDRGAGRGRKLRPSPVKVAAQEFGFPVAQPESHEELLSVLDESAPTVGLVVAYGRLLRPEVLAVAPHGFLNVHFSLLPRWRGAAPVERAIAAGDERTGVTLMKIDEGLDTGPVLAERATLIAPDDTGGILTARLAHLGARLVDDAVPQYLNGRRVPVPQIAAYSSHAKRLTRDEARISPTMTADEAILAARAFTPRPGPWCATDDGPLKITGFDLTRKAPAPAGFVSLVGEDVVLGCVDGGMVLTHVQPQGKGSMRATDWMNGRRGDPLPVAP